PGCGDQPRVRPEGDADGLARVRDRGDELHERLVARRLEWLAADGEAELRVACDRAQLVFDLLDRLAGDRSPLAGEQTARGVGRDPLPALDQRRVERSRPDELVTPASLQPLVELLQRDEDGAHLRDRVDAEVRPRAVRRHALRLDLEADEALVRDGELQL